MEHQINEEIRDKEVRLIADNGDQLGIVSSREALEIAIQKGMDLVKIAPQAQPPVCRIICLLYTSCRKAVVFRQSGTPTALAFFFILLQHRNSVKQVAGDYVWKEGDALVLDSSIGHTYINRQDMLLTFSSESQQGSDFRPF